MPCLAYDIFFGALVDAVLEHVCDFDGTKIFRNREYSSHHGIG